jgi:hypothetical protein
LLMTPHLPQKQFGIGHETMFDSTMNGPKSLRAFPNCYKPRSEIVMIWRSLSRRYSPQLGSPFGLRSVSTIAAGPVIFGRKPTATGGSTLIRRRKRRHLEQPRQPK